MSQQNGPADEEFREALEELISRKKGRAIRIAEMQREPSKWVTLFPAEVVTISDALGHRHSIFVKHLGSEQSDHPDKQVRDRETRVYEELLTDASLPCAEFYGWRRNEGSGRIEVFLEYVDDWNLKYHELIHWYTAARRLADLHSDFAERTELLRRCDFLIRFDVSYLEAWANRAVAMVADYAPESLPFVKEVVAAYRPIAELLAGQPVTLVHNDLSCKNVIADRVTDPARICIVDWEMAGIGCGLMDLSHLKFGLAPEAEDAVSASYRQRMTEAGMAAVRADEFDRALAASDLHVTLFRTAHSRDWQVPVETVAGWVEKADALVRRFTRPHC